MMPHHIGEFKTRAERESKASIYQRAIDMLKEKRLPLSKDSAEAAQAIKKIEKLKKSVLLNDSSHKIGLSQNQLSRGPSGSVTKIMNIKDALSSSPSYTIVTQHDQIVSMNHISEIQHQPIEESQLTYHKRNYLVASPSRNETIMAQKTQNLEKKKVYALNGSYIDTRSPIFS